MLTKEQKHFRKEMKKIKKEKGKLYHEIYEESAPSRFKEGAAINYGTLIRIGLFLAFFAWPMYQSVRRVPMLSKEGGQVSYSAQRPLDLIEATSPLVGKREEKLIWEEKKRIASELEGQLEEIAYRHKEESKLLLEKYGMSYTESEGRIEYRYRSHDLMPSV